MRKKAWLGLLLLLVATAFVVAVTPKPTESTSRPVRIGALLPLTGDAKIYGEEMQKGVELALTLYSNARSKPKIELATEDDAGQARTAVSGFIKLVEVNKAIAVIGGAMSSTAMPIAPIASSKKVVVISPAASAPALTKAGGYAFRVWPSDTYEATMLAELTVSKLKLKTAGIIFVNNDYGKGASEIFSRQFQKSGGSILLNEGYQQNSTDFRTILIKARSLKPEAIYIPGYYKELANLIKQATELGIKTQFLGGVGFQEPSLLKLVGAAAEGTIYTTPYYEPKAGDHETKVFVDTYMKTYSQEPGISAAHSYDATRVLLAAISKSDADATGPSVREALLRTRDFPGVAGTITFDDKGDVIKPVAFHIVRKGKFQPFETDK
ncbi:MAG: ABC transporter substrate-binding protein [Gammaproteobacteria bacterium]